MEAGYLYHHVMDGKELKRRREALGLSVAQLAELLDVTRISLHRWEREGIKERSGMLHLALRQLEDQALRGRLAVDWKEELRKEIQPMNEPITLVDCGYTWDTGVTPLDCRMTDGRYAHLRVIKNLAGIGVGDTQDAAVGDWPNRFAFDTDKSELTLDEFAARLPPWIVIKR